MALPHRKFWWLWLVAAVFLVLFVVMLVVALTGTWPKCEGEDVTFSYEPSQLLDFPMKETVNVSNFSAYGTRDWGAVGLFHEGTDLQVSAATTVVSPVDGVVSKYQVKQNTFGTQNWLYGVRIQIDDVWSVEITFEPMFDPADTVNHQAQLDNILVQEGDTLSRGQTVGTLLFSPGYCHIHYNLEQWDNKERRLHCPYQYSTPEAQAIYNQIQIASSTFPCCYGCP